MWKQTCESSLTSDATEISCKQNFCSYVSHLLSWHVVDIERRFVCHFNFLFVNCKERTFVKSHQEGDNKQLFMEGQGDGGAGWTFRTMHIAVYCLCSFIFFHHPRVYCKATLTFYMLILHDTGECICQMTVGIKINIDCWYGIHALNLLSRLGILPTKLWLIG